MDYMDIVDKMDGKKENSVGKTILVVNRKEIGHIDKWNKYDEKIIIQKCKIKIRRTGRFFHLISVSRLSTSSNWLRFAAVILLHC